MEKTFLITDTELISIVEMTVNYTVGKLMRELNIVKKDLISQRQAYIEFGESFVRKMVERKYIEGQRRGISDNSRIAYSRTKLLALKKADSIVELRPRRGSY